MGIRTLVRRLYALALDDPKSWDSSLWRFKGQMVAGENVNESTALTYSAVYNAVSLIAGTVSTLPLNLMSDRGGRKSIQDGLSAYRVLHTQANEYMSALALREVMMGHLLLWGNAYAEQVRDGMGNLIALWPITPDRIKPAWVDGSLAYQIKVDPGKPPITMPREKILHIPGLGFDGVQGYSVVAMARKSIGLGMALETFGSQYFAQGIHPSAVVTHAGRLSETGHKNLRTALGEDYGGLGQAHRVMLLEETSKFEKISIQPEESQFLESRTFQIPEIARWFNLPPHKLKDLTRSSFSNIESEQISFVTDSILPWLIRLEQTFNMQLLTPPEQRRLYWKHVVEGLMRGSAADRAAFYARMWGIGAMTLNEIRGKEDLPPVEGGDEAFVPANMVPLSRALRPPKLVSAPPQLPPAEPDPNAPTEPGQEPPVALLAPTNGKGHLHALTA
ncbi:MAG: phage portal protein [Planctomycetota bacterium]